MDNAPAGSNGHAQPEVPNESPLQEYLTILLRGKWVILLAVALVTAATAFFTFRMKPVYESIAMVLIDLKDKGGKVPFLDLTGTTATNKITNELETLKSRSTAEGVAVALVQKKYLDDTAGTIIPIAQALVDGEPVREVALAKDVTARLLKDKAVEFTPIRDSDIIKLTARSTDPREAALLANTYTQVYLDRNLSASRVKSRAVREFLQSQLQSKHAVLDTTEKVLQAYMRGSGVVSLDAETERVVKQLSQLEANRDALDVDISTRSRTLASYKEELSKQEPNIAKAIGESNDAYIRLIQEQLATLEVQRDVTIAQNPDLAKEKVYSDKLKQIDLQIASLKKKLQDRTQSYMASIVPGEGAGSGREGTSGNFLAQAKQKIIEQQIELDGLASKKTALARVIAEYDKQFNQIPQKSIELAKLQRSRLSSEKLYLLVEEKFNEAAIAETSEFGYVSVLDPAAVTEIPVSPKKAQNLILGLLVGLGLGIATVFIRAYTDLRVRTPEDLKKYGFIPLTSIAQMRTDGSHFGSGAGHVRNGKPFDDHLVAYHNPFSPIAESFRHLRTNVQYAQLDKPLKTIMITSPNPKEGKSTTAANLAITFAQTEHKVLLVDADMRRPTIHSLFGLKKDPGLTDLLFGSAQLEDVVWEGLLENLWVIAAGTTPPNPAEILGSRKMKEFIETVSKTYDIVIFDSPPVLAVTDAAVLTTATDGALLVVSSDITHVQALEKATEVLKGIGHTAVGVVLNNFDIKKAYGGYYGHKGYGYYGYGYYQSSNGNGQEKKKRGSRSKA
jgi:tyrosine-protein kinase Etk/Wzc